MQRHSGHIENVVLVARQLANLGSEVVFTGGAIVGLLLTDIAAPDVRPTDDVDVIVGITQYGDYGHLQNELRKLGFKHDLDGPNCRFILSGLKVDIMPSEGNVLGFTNRWYNFAIRSANAHALPDGITIRVVSATAFVATKLEAFYDRGKGDFILSHDIEDVIAVVDGRSELADEIKATEASVRDYVSGCFAALICDRDFVDSVCMHLLPDEGSQARARIIIDRITAISKLTGAT